MEFRQVVNDVIDRFNGCDEQSYDNFWECVSDALVYDWAIFAVVESIGSTCEILDGETINDYAQRLLGEYVEDGKFVEFIDD